MNSDLSQKIKSLPVDPGVYLMKNKAGEVIYVGKAKILKNRVSSYFTGIGSKDLKTQVLVREVADFDIILTKSESEALLLERNLIRVHNPLYNVLLKDGKEYPYVRCHFKDKWPRIEKVRRRKEDGAFYMGPFSGATYLNITLKLMGRVFPLIKCSRQEFKGRKRPCNYYGMKMCMGACCLEVDRRIYVEMINNALALLMGKNKEVIALLKDKMRSASDKEEFELAAQYRDQLQALENLDSKQSVVVSNVRSADAIAVYMGEGLSSINVTVVRDSKIVGNENFIVKSPIQSEEEVLESFITQYYDTRAIPEEIIVQRLAENLPAIMIALKTDKSLHRDFNTNCTVPKRGERFELLNMSIRNAQYNYEQNERERVSDKVELQLLKEFLHLKKLPHRMECIDISNMQGSECVASDVCFIDGKPDKSLYRCYIVKRGVEDVGETNSDVAGTSKPDDYASIREVFARRVERGVKDDDLPDLLVIDGGKGQLSSAVKALSEITPKVDLEIISLAKSRVLDESKGMSGEVMRSDERVFMVGKEHPIPLEQGSYPFRVLTYIRDEAHRFAITFHRKRMRKSFVTSDIDRISGIGPVLKKRLLETFGGLDNLKKASLDELLEVKGVKEDLAVAIYTLFNSKS